MVLFHRRTQEPQPTANPPSVLVMTMVRDEAEILPRWIAHYGRQVGEEHLLVLDDHSTDGSTDNLPCPVHRIPPISGQRFEPTRMRLLSGLAAGFLAVYDVVAFVDADEFLVPDPLLHADLPSYLAGRADRSALAPVALNVVHLPSESPGLRPDAPVLGQRQFAQFIPLMCKPSMKRVPAKWRWASHGIEIPFQIDPELFMIHMKFADRDALARVAARRKAANDVDGRAKHSSWAQEASEVVSALDSAVSGIDPDDVPELDVTTLDLQSVVVPRGDGWRAFGMGQMRALGARPIRRVPSRLLGTV